MGQDDFLDRNGDLLARLAYSYTNDGSDDVDLSSLYFGTSGTQLAVEDLGRNAALQSASDPEREPGIVAVRL
jgi:hypothetical protein